MLSILIKLWRSQEAAARIIDLVSVAWPGCPKPRRLTWVQMVVMAILLHRFNAIRSAAAAGAVA